MAADKLSAFVESIRSSGLLSDEDAANLVLAAKPTANPEALARDLVRNGKLTAYQARKFWRGQGSELILNQYVLMDKLGEGAMGEVFHARHLRLDRDVALKIIRRERLTNPAAIKRFQREIRAAATLAHENVVMAYDADQVGDVHFFAMEYVPGTNLENHVRRHGPLPLGEAAEYARQIALGLQHAHEKGLIHRDIKPSNLLLGRDGVVKISDLGLVRIDDANGDLPISKITKEGLTVGTPDFLAPEQARNPQGGDIRSDIYSLGCTFYFLLTGAVPHPSGTPTEKMLKHARESFPMPTGVPDPVCAILEKMTAKSPEDRFRTPQEVADALDPIAIRRPPPTPRSFPSIALDEPLTDDTLPIPPKSDSTFKFPIAVAPAKPRNRLGCLGIFVMMALPIVSILLRR